MDGLIIKHKSARCRLDDGPIWRSISVSKVASRHKRKGHGNGLMLKICKAADSLKRMLVLAVDDDSPEWLLDFYGKHGFEIVQHFPIIMARRVNGREPRED